MGEEQIAGRGRSYTKMCKYWKNDGIKMSE